MPQAQPAEILRIHISESDRFDGKPLYEAMIAKCREMEIAGATVFRGLEGYGETAELHRAHLVHNDRPIVIVVVDSPENIRRLIPALTAMVNTGLLASSPAEMVRVREPAPAAN